MVPTVERGGGVRKNSFQTSSKPSKLARSVWKTCAFTTWSIIRASKKPAPVFEDKEKVRFDGLVWVPGRQGGSLALGLTVPIR